MMTDSELHEFVLKAEQIYDERLRSLLEPQHLEEFIAIEPESGEYVLGTSYREVGQAARRDFPGRLTHVMRVGKKPALHLGWRFTWDDDQ